MTKYRKFAGRIKKVTELPSNPVDGDEVFLTGAHAIMRYNGSVWKGMKLTTTSTSTTTTSTSSSTSTTKSTSTTTT